MIKLKRLDWGGVCSAYGKMRNAYKILVGKLEGRGQFRRYRCRWEDNIKIDFRNKGVGIMDWIRLVQDRTHWRAFVNMLMNLRAPYRTENLLSS
jgi:hypothetical protein